MPRPTDTDAHLAALQLELRETITTLNQLHHPVYPVPAERTQALEARVTELRAAIRTRRDELAASS